MFVAETVSAKPLNVIIDKLSARANTMFIQIIGLYKRDEKKLIAEECVVYLFNGFEIKHERTMILLLVLSKLFYHLFAWKWLGMNKMSTNAKYPP